MNTQQRIKLHMEQLNDNSICFNEYFLYYQKEQKGTNEENVVQAWRVILRKCLIDILNTMKQLKEEMAWSMLDEKRGFFGEIIKRCTQTLLSYREYEEEDVQQEISNIFFFT